MADFPSSSSPSLALAHPSPAEIYKIHELSSIEWAGALTKEQYIENEHDLASLLNITHWILTQTGLPPDKRSIFASCETIRKRCFVTDEDVGVRGAAIQAIAGVFCEPKMRRHGYAGRMLEELKMLLHQKKTDEGEIEEVGSILFSDIGPEYYAKFGWAPFPSTMVELPASPGLPKIATKVVLAKDISDLCAEDQAMLLDSIGDLSASTTSMAIVPDHNTVLWHHMKEDYICQKLFGRQPKVKGAVAGKPGDRVWAIWTRGIYGPLNEPDYRNKLYILRLVIENPEAGDIGKQAEQLKSVLQAAQHEAAEWTLGHVELWNPDKRTRELIDRMGIEYRFSERQHEGIPGLMWFDDGDSQNVKWIASEKYAWC
ncbi:hypothetical protein D0Z07_3640 [Hyphodiscus hymeniophilus]|uniref:LYC1 C-terminal domain-containing protein n=1 Tax=Hyphodiscus hymeniophilus TaxID=353542 RepID=A0A9P6VL68_9HELO|nr:hypothetical protein D0Z07_3640 [Hyphodiscus hymeniophilus]